MILWKGYQPLTNYIIAINEVQIYNKNKKNLCLERTPISRKEWGYYKAHVLQCGGTHTGQATLLAGSCYPSSPLRLTLAVSAKKKRPYFLTRRSLFGLVSPFGVFFSYLYLVARYVRLLYYTLDKE